jgi:hypothetical protein
MPGGRRGSQAASSNDLDRGLEQIVADEIQSAIIRVIGPIRVPKMLELCRGSRQRKCRDFTQFRARDDRLGRSRRKCRGCPGSVRGRGEVQHQELKKRDGRGHCRDGRGQFRKPRRTSTNCRKRGRSLPVPTGNPQWRQSGRLRVLCKTARKAKLWHPERLFQKEYLCFLRKNDCPSAGTFGSTAFVRVRPRSVRGGLRFSRQSGFRSFRRPLSRLSHISNRQVLIRNSRTRTPFAKRRSVVPRNVVPSFLETSFGRSYLSALANAAGPAPRKIVACVRSGRGSYTHVSLYGGTPRSSAANWDVGVVMSSTFDVVR